MLRNLLKKLIDLNFSDLHLCEEKVPYVRDATGKIHALNFASVSREEIISIVTEITGIRSKEILESKTETNIAYGLEGIGRLRVNIYSNIHGIGLAFRLISNSLPSFEKFSMPPILKTVCALNNGLVLITGATGSGKTTTLAAMVDYINQSYKKNIIIIEDPIEFIHNNNRSNIIQREIRTHTKDYQTAVHSAMRQDPDIIILGELIDRETMRAALTLAETGHLVISTLHTPSAIGSISRIIHTFPSEEQQQIKNQLSGTLRTIISQILIPKKDGSGKIASHEILVSNEAIANLIGEGDIRQIYSMMQMGQAEGMELMSNSIIQLIKNGIITLEDGLAVHNKKDEILKHFQNSNYALS